MKTNNNNLVDFSKEYTYVASESLVQEAKEKHSNIYLNFSYTNYGGSFLDKVIISYFKEYYPENIVHERTAWYGENAFVFGKPAKELFQQIENGNILDFDNLTYYYYAKFYEQVTEEATNFVDYSDNDLYNNMEAKRITINQAKKVLENVHVGKFETGLRTNLKRVKSKCYTTTYEYNGFLENATKLAIIAEVNIYRVFEVERSETCYYLKNDYTEYNKVTNL